MSAKENVFRVLRSCLGLTAKEMAERCSISAVYLSELERGVKANPSDQVLTRIADASGMSREAIGFYMGAKDFDYAGFLVSSLQSYADRYISERKQRMSE